MPCTFCIVNILHATRWAESKRAAMSDTLPDVERFVQSMLTFAVPVVTALILVLVVYMYSLGAAPAPPPLLLVDEPTSTKKERALAKKRLKQQQQQQKVSDSFW